MLASLKGRARRLETETYALYLAYMDPTVPWFAKAFAALVVAYAVSPIDLIPDFIPVLGYLDDLFIVPAGIAVALRLIPPEAMARARLRAASALPEGKLKTRAGIAIVVVVWAVAATLVVVLLARAFRA